MVTSHYDDALTSAGFDLLADQGVIDSLGGFGVVHVPHFRAYERGATLRVFRGNAGPEDVAATVRAVIAGEVRPSDAYTSVVDWDDLPAAYSDPNGKPVAVRPGASPA